MIVISLEMSDEPEKSKSGYNLKVVRFVCFRQNRIMTIERNINLKAILIVSFK